MISRAEETAYFLYLALVTLDISTLHLMIIEQSFKNCIFLVNKFASVTNFTFACQKIL